MTKCLGIRTESRFGADCKCDREATHDENTHCIFHAKKKDPAEFERALEALVYEWKIRKIDRWDFSGFEFTEDIKISSLALLSDSGNYHFPVEIFFSGARFHKEADFKNIEFLGFVDFTATVFNNPAEFSCAKFRGSVRFHRTKFGSFAFFDYTEFNVSVDFSKANFRNSAYFRNSTFHDESLFDETVFEDFVFFDRVSFARCGNFRKCEIVHQIKWTWPGEGIKRDNNGNRIDRGVMRFMDLKFDRNCWLDLRDNKLQVDTKLEICNCEMCNILLEGTDCTQIRFFYNKWPDMFDRFGLIPGLKLRRVVVGDEFQKHLIDYNPALIRRTYQQLAKRFREDLDHSRANEFVRGAFEMRRLEALAEMKGTSEESSKARGWGTYVGLSIYKYVSHYSGNLALPMFWWVLLLLVCAVCYAVFEYADLIWSFQHADINFMCSRVMESFRASFSPTIIENDTELIQTIKVAQKVISAVLITMFIFAIRRRFMH